VGKSEWRGVQEEGPQLQSRGMCTQQTCRSRADGSRCRRDPGSWLARCREGSAEPRIGRSGARALARAEWEGGVEGERTTRSRAEGTGGSASATFREALFEGVGARGPWRCVLEAPMSHVRRVRGLAGSRVRDEGPGREAGPRSADATPRLPIDELPWAIGRAPARRGTAPMGSGG